MTPFGFRHTWVPSQEPGNRRTLLLLHGTGGDESDLLPIGKTLDPAANLLSPRGRIDEMGSNRFFRRFGHGVFDQENMRQETDALASFLRRSAEEYGFDPANVYAVGFSNGANIAASLILRYPELLRGAFLMRAMVPFEPDPIPSLMGSRVLLSSGEQDPLVPREDAERLAAIFTEGGADVEHLWLSGGHNLTKQELEHARKWLAVG